MWVKESEDQVDNKIRFPYRERFIIGMAFSSSYGLTCMDSSFDSMLYSGKIGGELVHKRLCEQ